MQGIQAWTNPDNGFRVVRTHYTADPIKRTKEWYDKTRKGYTKTAWEQEFEISFVSYTGKGVYVKEYSGLSTDDGGNVLLSHGLAPGKPIYRIWDFGYHHPAVLFVQEIYPGVHYCFDELMGSDIYLWDFIPEVFSKTEDYAKMYNGVKKDFCDKAGTSVKDTGKSAIQILHEFKVHPSYQQFGIVETLDYVRGAITSLNEERNMPALVVDSDRCPILHSGFLGGYRYPDEKPGKREEEMPTKDGYYDHLHDTLRYYAGFKLRYFSRRKKHAQDQNRINRQINASKLPTERRDDPRRTARTGLQSFDNRYPGGGTRVPSSLHRTGDQRPESLVGGVARRQLLIARDYGGPTYTRR